MKNIPNTVRTFMVLCLMWWPISLLQASTLTAPTTGPLVTHDHPPVSVEIALTGRQDKAQQRVDALLNVRLADDWKTYWRSPGEGGVKPSLDWSASENIRAIDWYWPLPEAFSVAGIQTYGYQKAVSFPLQITLADNREPAVLRGTLTLPSCTSVCVLTDYPIDLMFTATALEPEIERQYQFNQWMSRVPQPSPQLDAVAIAWSPEQNRVSVIAERTIPWLSPKVLIDGEGLDDVTFKPLNLTVEGHYLEAQFEVASWLNAVDLMSAPLAVTFSDQHFIAEQTVRAVLGPVSQHQPFWQVLIAALLGGLILNVMPCVLPVLGLKLTSVTAVAGKAKRRVRQQFVASAFGILCSFWLIAAMLIGLKLAGQSIGWGIQFQSPYFLLFMVVITLLFATNLWGLWQVNLPSSWQTWIAQQGGDSRVGHFTQGAFATLLATPCSAPFFGTAVAFALGAETGMLLLIFTLLGLGMALPWLVVALFPVCVAWLPKPGRWMSTLKVIMGLMISLTTVWLLTLLRHHVNAGVLGMATLLIATVILVRVKTVHGAKLAMICFSLSLLTSGLMALLLSLNAHHWATPLPKDWVWQDYSSQAVNKALSVGDIVFVDASADWCITCKANKIGVLLQEPVYSELQAEGVTTLHADWTVPNETVTDLLRQHGQYGVPFNIVYGPGAPLGIPLPTILSKEAVIEALAKAKGAS
ncbi:protein-disulfide reductase DsbD family protein [Thaumasiovibrio subtropicus]|uniref:protein-disulfide reductase DsbD family protein n=1 Tax=Thaumasiovibrio subtropicus TaxID=1891207 RepID=UPI000B361E63|nr:protein-disulfide reductase DsbD domain-containing protein [Thaumasiovibrio subtropicus]